MKNATVISSLVCVLALAGHESLAQMPSASGAGSPEPGSDGGPFVVPRSTVHLLPSQIVDQVYELRVSIPEDYGNDDGLRPVIYALDGQWNFNLISDIVGKLAYDGLIPDPIVVAITWAGGGAQPAAQRARDFTPVATPLLPGSGGGAKFLKVLENEVFPFIESHYRASRERVITGGSLGGLFVGYALVERPDLFQGYVASSGAFDLAAEYFTPRLQELPPDFLRDEHAYFTVGSQYDNEQVVKDFVADLDAATNSRYIDLDVIPGVGHTGNEPFAYTRGLIHAFQRPNLHLSPRFLKRYEGAYFDPSAPDLPDLIVQVDHGQLTITEDGEQWPFEFLAATPEHFYVDGFDVDFTFHRTDQGGLAFTLDYRRTIYEQVRR
jgi:predicted alpha/beta superfamily hydrolase